MKNFLRLGFAMIIGILTHYNVSGQNPNWTMPPYKFNIDTDDLELLPGSNTYDAYDGSPSTHLDAAYSDNDGNLILFTVDENVYDKNGDLVDKMHIGASYEFKMGHSQRLILPMGNDCKRYAIIYQASPKSDEDYISKQAGRRIYMAIYNLEGEMHEESDHGNEEAIGALNYYEYDSFGLSGTLMDISLRDAGLHGKLADSSNLPIYDIHPGSFNKSYLGGGYYQGYASNHQIVATELIDNCFYYVLKFRT